MNQTRTILMTKLPLYLLLPLLLPLLWLQRCAFLSLAHGSIWASVTSSSQDFPP